MNKIDSIFDRLKEQQPVIDNPDELTDMIMDSLPEMHEPEKKKNQRVYLYVASLIAGAASVLFLLLFHYDNRQTDKPSVQRPQIVKQDSARKIETKSVPIVMDETKSIARSVSAKPMSKPKERVNEVKEAKAVSTYSDADSLEYYISKIERELGQVDDSLYIERIQRVLHADERLQRIVNNYILYELHRDVQPHEAINTNNVITEENE